MRIPLPVSVLALALTLSAGPAIARPDTTPPEWEQLSQPQRDALIATMRDRWNAEPETRARMLRHAERWQQMTPEQRQRASDGMKHWRGMSPERRDEARALYQRMRALPPAEREALRERWKDMNPGQRREWLEQNPPAR